MANFNEDMLMEIFSWLSGKNLCKFFLVSKSVNMLLSDDFFIRKQSKNMRFLGDSDFFIQSYGYNETLQFHGNDKEENRSTVFSPCKTGKFWGGFGEILASFNGLICSRKDEKGPLFVFNPTTRSYMRVLVPTHESRFDIIFCGEDLSTCDYTLLAIISPSEWDGESQFKVFSPREKVWKDLAGVDFGKRNILFPLTVQLEGVLYFISDSGRYFLRGRQSIWPYIVAYDTKAGTSKFLNIPKNARRGSWESNFAIFKWGRPHSSDDLNGTTICLVRLWRKKFTIWALYTSYWKRVFHMRIKVMGLSDFNSNIGFNSYNILNGKNLILATDKKLYCYNLLDSINARFQEVCDHDFDGAMTHIHSCHSTLRRCGPDQAIVKM